MAKGCARKSRATVVGSWKFTILAFEFEVTGLGFGREELVNRP
jgi:hypothetical protein